MDNSAIKAAVAELPANDRAKLLDWLADIYAQLWDDQIADDLDEGRLDALLEEIEHEYAAWISPEVLTCHSV
jgi:hypothetical protein